MKDETNGTCLRLLNGPAADRWAVNCFLGGAMLYFVCALYSHTLLPQQNAFQAPVQLLYLCAVALLVGKILLFTRYTRPQLAAWGAAGGSGSGAGAAGSGPSHASTRKPERSRLSR